MNSKIVLTGDRPTGKLHLGHYVGSLKNRVELQNKYKQFVFLADTQALTDNAGNPQKIKNNIIEVALDYLAVGINPKKTTIFIQSMIPALAELNLYYLNLVSIARLERNPTIKEEIKLRKFNDGNSIPAGFLTYPVSQAADITAFNANLVPVGEDQLPLIEQCREIVRKFNSLYDQVLVEPESIISDVPRLVGIDGQAKMSKSLGNCIYLADSEEEIKQKVMNMFTDPNHLYVSDPGKVEGNPVFIYLDAFGEDNEKIEDLKQHYQKGGLGDVTVKKYLLEILLNMLKPIREKREDLAKNKDYIYEVLKEGCDAAKQVAELTLLNVKKAMGINYFC